MQTGQIGCLHQCGNKPTVLDWRKSFNINIWPLSVGGLLPLCRIVAHRHDASWVKSIHSAPV